MNMKKMMEDLVAPGLFKNSQEKVSPVPDPDNYIRIPLVTFYDMPEPPDLFNPLKETRITNMKKMTEDLVAPGSLKDSQKKASPVPDPDNYIRIPLVTFSDMPESPDLFNPLP
ncbi:MAG: hypothetical protein OXF19_05465 [Hyphomicrobiales bacterium]|nr:hypothetical protein [Hyphomicrobiales bacterium]